MLKYWLGIVGLFVWGGCSTSFTPQEVKVIKEGGGIMRVWKTDNREDSLFLRQQAIELTPGEIRTELFQVLKQRMLATVNDSADPGVGIAAPQVGISRRLIAVQRYDKPGAPFEFYINPGIVSASEEQSLGKEGCLSVPDVVGEVWRSNEIVVRYIPELTSIKRMLSREKTDSTFKFEVKVEYLTGPGPFLYHLYDDRGLDILGGSRELLLPLYHQFNDWILEYNLEKIDRLFAPAKE